MRNIKNRQVIKNIIYKVQIGRLMGRIETVVGVTMAML